MLLFAGFFLVKINEREQESMKKKRAKKSSSRS